jgi:hypothetical protein
LKKHYGTFDGKMEKNNPIIANIVINRFKRSCDTFRKGGGKNPSSSMTLG